MKKKCAILLTITSFGLAALNFKSVNLSSFAIFGRQISLDNYLISLNSYNRIESSETDSNFIRRTDLGNDVIFTCENANEGDSTYFAKLSTAGSVIKNNQSIKGIKTISITSDMTTGSKYELKYWVDGKGSDDYESVVVDENNYECSLLYSSNFFTIKLIEGSVNIKTIDIDFSCSDVDKDSIQYIRTKEELLSFRENIQSIKYAKLCNSIDLGDTTFGRAIHGNTFVGNYEDTEAADTFTGVFDGQGFKIVNGYFGGCGFFKNIAEGAVVKNIEFKNASLTSYGWKSDARSTTIFANYVSGEVKDVLIDCEVIRVLDDNGVEGAALCRNFTSTADVSNVIVYWHPFECRYADGSYEGSTNATYGTAVVNVEYQSSNLGTLNNVYLFSPHDPAGHTSVTKNDYTTTCAEAGLPTASGFSSSLWDFSGSKANLIAQ